MTLDKRLKTIRSFVRREGRMTPAQKQALQVLFPVYGLTVDAGIFNFQTIFKNNNPVILEIGFGMGDTLFEMAQQHPNKNFIGIEVYRPGIGALLNKLHGAEINNVRLIECDAVEVLQNNIPDMSLQAIQIFFPDPWPKKRHHKRRLIQSDFVVLLHQKLQKGGVLHLATDWEDYANRIQAVIRQNAGFVLEKPFDHATTQYRRTRPTTKFERRGKQLGHPIWDLCFYKN